jgi:hypothetical protein
MDLAALKAHVADVEVDYKGHLFTVGYRPESVSEDDLQLFDQFGETSGIALLRATVAPLVRLLVSWSLTNGDEPLAVDEQRVAALPPRMRMAILENVMRDFFAPGNASPSDAGSPAPAASEGTVPTTHESSSTRNGQESHRGISPGSPILAAL